jgi:hypothetical protein
VLFVFISYSLFQKSAEIFMHTTKDLSWKKFKNMPLKAKNVDFMNLDIKI